MDFLIGRFFLLYRSLKPQKLSRFPSEILGGRAFNRNLRSGKALSVIVLQAQNTGFNRTPIFLFPSVLIMMGFSNLKCRK